MRYMNVKDGFAVKTAVDKGFIVGIITGGNSGSVTSRFKGLGVTDIYINSHDKLNERDGVQRYSVHLASLNYVPRLDAVNQW